MNTLDDEFDKSEKPDAPTTFYDIPREIIGHILFTFLSPTDIQSCFSISYMFHSLSKKQHDIIKRAGHITLHAAVMRNDTDLYYYLFDLHQLHKRNPICFQAQDLLSIIIENNNIEIFTHILTRASDVIITPQIVANAIYYSAQYCNVDIYGDYTIKLIDKAKEYNINPLELTYITQYEGVINVIYNMFHKDVVLGKLEKIKKLKDKCNLDVPRNLLDQAHPQNIELISYIQQYGV